jgi:cellulose synthase/poly-beta-1,6-N-acetylglucosamine synthase-like glycosyltransferase
MWFIIVSAGLLVFYISLLTYYCIGWDKLQINNANDAQPSTSVCIILPARNEEESIKACIESLLQQSYPKDLMEIIVVDDFSEDDTASIVKNFDATSVKLISLKEIVKEIPVKSYKKAAITEAINQTKAELIITTDADCIAGKDWVATVVNCCKESGAVCVAGPVFIKEDGNFFHEIQAIDMAAFAGIAGATIALNHPVLCNGANFTFKRDAFLAVGGYEGVNHITSGDDLLLLYKFRKLFPGKIKFCKSPKAAVETNAVDNLPAFLNQRLRWASKSVSYNDKKVTLILALVYLFYLSIIAGFLLSLISKKYVYLLIAQLFVKLFADIIFMQRVLNFFNRRTLLSIFLPAQIFHIVYVLVTGVAALFIPLRWKGRKVYR